MTFARIWVWLRWPLALLLMVAIVRYAMPRFLDAAGSAVSFNFGDSLLFAGGSEEPSAEPTGAPSEVIDPTLLQRPAGPVEDGSATPVADFDASEGSVDDLTAEELVIGDVLGDVVLLAFNLVDGDPDCLTSMELAVEVLAADGETEIGIWPTYQGDAATFDQFEAIADPLVFPGLPTALAGVAAPGRLEQLDVLAAYRAIFDAGLPAGSVFTLAVQPTGTLEEGGGVVFASSEAGDEAPVLSWTGAPGCPVGEPAGTGAAPTTTPTGEPA